MYALSWLCENNLAVFLSPSPWLAQQTKHVTSEDTSPQGRSPSSSAASGRFVDKVALITGVSDRGIGGAIAERLMREGAALALSALDEPGRLLRRIERFAGKAVWTRCDVRLQDEVERAVEDCATEFGRIDVLINNAGVELAQPLSKFSSEQWQVQLDVNLGGAIRVTQAALPFLTEPGGCIVNIGSALGSAGCAGYSIYSASKAGMEGFTRCMAIELAPQRIRSVCIAPAMVETPMVFKHLQFLTPEVRKHIAMTHPLGTGSPHDVAAAVAFLASDEARWITGITLPMGWTQHYPLPVEQFLAETS